MPPESRHTLVIGAGLAGAAATASLVRKGWRVTLLDAASGPAQAASALPVGMLSPHVTRTPTPLSRLCEIGVAATRAELERLIAPGEGWQPCEVDNLQHDPGRWPAALVRPGALVRAWLFEAEQTGALTSVWNANVRTLSSVPTSFGAPQWQARSAQGEVLAQAPFVVVAAALGSLALLDADQSQPEAWPLRPVKGQMSMGAQEGPPLAERPQRQNGVFVPAYEDAGLAPLWPSRLWAMGATYDRGDPTTHATLEAHTRNASSLANMHPSAAEALRRALTADQLLGWAQVRCASLDRLPLAGAVPDLTGLKSATQAAGSRRGRLALAAVPRAPGLFTLCALGSRGLTLALPMAQLLSDTMSGEASPLEADLQRAVDPARFAWRQARRQASAA